MADSNRSVTASPANRHWSDRSRDRPSSLHPSAPRIILGGSALASSTSGSSMGRSDVDEQTTEATGTMSGSAPMSGGSVHPDPTDSPPSDDKRHSSPSAKEIELYELGKNSMQPSSAAHHPTDGDETPDSAERAHHDADVPKGRGKRRTTLVQAAMRARNTVPSFLKPSNRVRLWQDKLNTFFMAHMNFYRIHLLVFTFTPLIFSAIFYASNVTPIAYIDCLFVCVTAMTVTGLTPINISTATSWQQAILFFLMIIGNLSAVSVTMIWIRRHFFRVKFDTIIRRSAKARKRMNDVEYAHQKEKRKELIRLQRLVGLRKRHKNHSDDGDGDATPGEGALEFERSPRSSASTDEIAEAELQAERVKKKKERQQKKKQGPLRADMIRRMDQPAVLINPMGAISHAVRDRANSVGNGTDSGPLSGGILNTSGSETQDQLQQQQSGDAPNVRITEPNLPRRRISDPLEGRPSYSPERMTEAEETEMQIALAERQRTRRPSLTLKKETSVVPEEHVSADAAQVRTRFEEGEDWTRRARRESDPPARNHMRQGSDVQAYRTTARHDMFPRAQTIEFADPPHPPHTAHVFGGFGTSARSTALAPPQIDHSMRYRTPTGNATDFERTGTSFTARSGTGYAPRRVGTHGMQMTRTNTSSKERGFGGFPTPLEIAGHALKRALPHVQDRFKRTTTMPRTATFASTHSVGGMTTDSQAVKAAPYLSFDATVSRNSRFHQLTEAQRDELGGVEYRAIDLLAKLIPIYWLGLNFFFIILVAPWLAVRSASVNANAVIDSQGQYAVDTTWFWFFNVVSAYSNTGLSLIDTSMTQLADQYLMLMPMAFLILAGNTAFPIFLRFFIWMLSLVTPKSSRLYETLRFLLDHPRRCFVYLFPSAQTWFLFGVLIILNCFDWIMFQVLDLGNPVIESWGVGQRIFDGLFQSIAVRAAGFQIISLLELAPAVQFLYIIMMYISVYPVAMSVRNTNVYEERSLGIFNDSEVPNPEDEPAKGGPRVWGTYLAAHARRQLAFDMWWLGFALWLVCIIERHNIQDPATNGWFTVFSCLFELTSAYGTVGLSTGTPTDAFSLSGRFHTLSKLVVIAVMLRGRHRGLPVAIDRAVLLPDDQEVEDDAQEAAYTIDEDGMIRTRSSYVPDFDREDDDDDGEGEREGGNVRFTSSSGPSTFLPRSATNTSVPRTPGGMRRMSRERSVPMLDLDALRVDADERKVEPKTALDPEDHQADSHGYLTAYHHHQLASIREASGATPLPSPAPYAQTTMKSYGLEAGAAATAMQDSGASSADGARSPSLSSEEKGKARDTDDKEVEFADRYGCNAEPEKGEKAA